MRANHRMIKFISAITRVVKKKNNLSRSTVWKLDSCVAGIFLWLSCIFSFYSKIAIDKTIVSRRYHWLPAHFDIIIIFETFNDKKLR